MMKIRNLIYYVALFTGGTCFDNPGGIFGVQNGFIALAGAIVFIQLLDKLDSCLIFLGGIAIATFVGNIICGSRFIPFFSGYILPLIYLLYKLISCYFSNQYNIPLQSMFEQIRNKILHGQA